MYRHGRAFFYLPGSLPFVVFVIHEDEFTEALQAAVKGFAVVGLCELVDKTNQIGVAGNHDGGDGNS